jgi:hypothetical protein
LAGDRLHTVLRRLIDSSCDTAAEAAVMEPLRHDYRSNVISDDDEQAAETVMLLQCEAGRRPPPLFSPDATQRKLALVRRLGVRGSSQRRQRRAHKRAETVSNPSDPLDPR